MTTGGIFSHYTVLKIILAVNFNHKNNSKPIYIFFLLNNLCVLKVFNPFQLMYLTMYLSND